MALIHITSEQLAALRYYLDSINRILKPLEYQDRQMRERDKRALKAMEAKMQTFYDTLDDGM